MTKKVLVKEKKRVIWCRIIILGKDKTMTANSKKWERVDGNREYGVAVFSPRSSEGLPSEGLSREIFIIYDEDLLWDKNPSVNDGESGFESCNLPFACRALLF